MQLTDINFLYNTCHGNQNSIVGIVTFCYRLDNPMSDSGQDKRFFSSPNVQTCSGIHPASYSRVSGVLSVGKVARVCGLLLNTI